MRHGSPRWRVTAGRLHRSIQHGGLGNDSDTTMEQRIPNGTWFSFSLNFANLQIEVG